MRRPLVTLVPVAAAVGLLLTTQSPSPRSEPAGATVVFVAEPDPRVAQFARRAPHRERLDADLAAGRVTLAAAVRRFEAVSRRWPVPEEGWLPLISPRRCHAEGWPPLRPGRCHGVRRAEILFVRAMDMFGDDDPRREEVLCRLTAELTELLTTGELADVGPGNPGPGWLDPDETTDADERLERMSETANPLPDRRI